MGQDFDSAPSPGGEGWGEGATPPSDDNRRWRTSLLWLAILIGLVVALQLASLEIRGTKATAGGGDAEQALMSGDFLVKAHQAWPSRVSTASAINYYETAVPSAAALRRIGVLKGEAGRLFFLRLDRADTTEGLNRKQISKLRQEKAMWLRIYDSARLSPDETRRYTDRIEALDLGPLKEAAIAKVYERSGRRAKSLEMLQSIRQASRKSLTIGIILLTLLGLGGILGFVIALIFLADSALRFAAAPLNPLSPTILISAFVVYLASYISFGAAGGLIADALGSSAVSAIASLALMIASALLAFTLGILTLTGGASRLGQDWREIGFRTRSVGRDVARGLAGFCASLPFLFLAATVSYALQQTLFRHIETPRQPFGGIVSRGGGIEIFLVFLAAAVVAPIVEETFFRGVLYSAFRDRWRVWPSVLLTSVIFAAIHPLPGGFLPIFTLSCVLALLRERSGSLLPGMVTHGVFNTIQLLIAMIAT